jgi:hypothetical protein
MIWSQPRQIVPWDLPWKTLHKNRAGGVAQGESPEFKPQHHKKKILRVLWSITWGENSGGGSGGVT